ncbi:expressed unknown protein [Seminavis robusta]|uniref:Uncharacterized protein n=1 Tax=Seminavis robusta TaxID=568900 RepID=A0A9N8E1Z2_9STRA|nr:expressed unknown protein [Seminavis robusta]|eukprot:Sro463_g148180.1 n/a (110) ;mRNA; f:24171-24500
MDASTDAMICTQTCTRGSGRGYVCAPAHLRASRSLENRAPVDADLRLLPGYEVVDNIHVEKQDQDDHANTRRSSAGKYASQLARNAQDRLTRTRDQRVASQAHILMLAL